MNMEDRFARFGKMMRNDLPCAGKKHLDFLAADLAASAVRTQEGDYLIREQSYGPGDTHGRFSFAEFDPDRLLSFGNFSCPPQKGEFALRDVVFIDTETTGLSGGVGTVPFMVGLGFFRDNQFILRQHLLPDFCEEQGYLLHLFDDLPGKNIISFNGRAFDIPLLLNRFLIHRAGSDFFTRGHLNILFTLRRFFRQKLPDCTLKSAESALLGFERLNDIPSEQIPQVYFDFLRSGDTRALYQVLVHNRWDLLSTLALTVELSRHVEESQQAASLSESDSWALGRFFWGQRDYFRAFCNFSRCQNNDKELYYRNIFQAARAAKRLNDFETAISYWDMLSEGYNLHYLPALEELAKAFEHRQKALEPALQICQRALRTIEQLEQLSPDYDLAIWKGRFQKRQSRLFAKSRKNQ